MKKHPATSRVDELVSSISDKNIVIGTHRKADIDALASAYAFSSIFKHAIVCMPDEPNTGAKNLAELLGIKYKLIKDLDRKKFAGMIVVDTSAYELLKEAKDWNLLCIIDHHTPEGRDMKADIEIIDEKAASTCEIVARILFEKHADKLNKSIAFALACGIIADTARFKRGCKETFAMLAKLMDVSGADYEDLLVCAEPEFELDEKIAIIKSFQRVNYMISSGFLIATSQVGSNESIAAATISEVADIVFVASWRNEDKETRISARSRKHVKIEMNKVMAEVGNALGGAGGGHMHAAGASAKAEPNIALKRCVETAIAALGGARV